MGRPLVVVTLDLHNTVSQKLPAAKFEATEQRLRRVSQKRCVVYGIILVQRVNSAHNIKVL